MSLSKYETFMEVVKTQNMSKAAANTHQTVPGISYTIARLEEEWGIPLFVRNRGKISLSEAGEELLPYITDVLDAQQRLENVVLSIKGAEQGSVRVGGLRCATRQWLPGIIKDMNEEYPNIQIKLLLNLYEEIQNDLLEGVIDVAFAGEPSSKMLDFYHVIDDPYVVIMSKSSPLCEKSEISLAEITDQNLIMPNWSVDKSLMNLVEKSNMKGQISQMIKDTGTIISMVESGIGISILPGLMIVGEKADVGMARLLDWPAKRFGIVTSVVNKPSPSTRKFIQCAKKWLNENYDNLGYRADK